MGASPCGEGEGPRTAVAEDVQGGWIPKCDRRGVRDHHHASHRGHLFASLDCEHWRCRDRGRRAERVHAGRRRPDLAVRTTGLRTHSRQRHGDAGHDLAGHLGRECRNRDRGDDCHRSSDKVHSLRTGRTSERIDPVHQRLLTGRPGFFGAPKIPRSSEARGVGHGSSIRALTLGERLDVAVPPRIATGNACEATDVDRTGGRRRGMPCRRECRSAARPLTSRGRSARHAEGEHGLRAVLLAGSQHHRRERRLVR